MKCRRKKFYCKIERDRERERETGEGERKRKMRERGERDIYRKR